MPAINNVLVARDTMSHLAKRSNWAQREAGVIVVFCIVFIVLVGVIGLFATVYGSALRSPDNGKAHRLYLNGCSPKPESPAGLMLDSRGDGLE
ncbi:hypothetical protein VSDG_05410 [Cytospora chrysosperma]|uniref:Uncharacterized protein n=1 Tax=Cytospora chrysosperma TaxID=252740 RepID=A0A423VZ74_CYTCH|nr:hypothetical protein VSDG_05410 [Valsa sordida]